MEVLLKQILAEIVNLKDGQERIELKVDNLSLELKSNFKYTNDKQDELKSTLLLANKEINDLKVNVKHHSRKLGEFDTEINKLNERIES